MGNKYVWVIFNLVCSIGLMIWLIMDLIEFNDNETKEGGFIILLVFAGLAYWIFKSIRYWRKCIEVDDPNFKRVVEELDRES
jgi:hypothetical protein